MPAAMALGETPEGLEQLRQVFLRDPLTVVGDVDGDPSGFLAHGDRDRAALRRILHRIGDEVAEDRLDLFRICPNADPAWRLNPDRPGRPSAGRGSCRRRHRPGEGIDADVLGVLPAGAYFHTAGGQHPVDQLAHVAHARGHQWHDLGGRCREVPKLPSSSIERYPLTRVIGALSSCDASCRNSDFWRSSAAIRSACASSRSSSAGLKALRALLRRVPLPDKCRCPRRQAHDPLVLVGEA